MWGYAQKPVLGKLSATPEATEAGSDIRLEHISYRCKTCRTRVSVAHGNSLFPDLGKHSKGVSMHLFTHWMDVESYTMTQMSRALRVAETSVRRWAESAREVMAAEA